MMSKDLELVGVNWQFGVPRDRTEDGVPPQSVIPSLVEYVAGSMLALLGNPDLRMPIALSRAQLSLPGAA